MLKLGALNMNRKLTDEQKIEIIEKFAVGDRTQVSLAKEYNVSPPAIMMILRRNMIGIYKRNIEIVEKYLTGEYTCADLGREYGITRTSINNLLRQRSVEIFNDKIELSRKYSVNENYFDCIDTQEKAYFLGLLYADGCNREETCDITISLQEGDKHILDSFKEHIELTRPLRFCDYKSKCDRYMNQYVLCIKNTRMSQQLAKLGCFARKSLTLKFPTEEQLPKYLLIHFLRGMWDGDGNIFLKGTKISCSLSSTIYICEAVKELLEDDFNIPCRLYRPKTSIINKTTSRNVFIKGVFNMVKFLDLLYTDANVYLNRKYEKYKEIKIARARFIDSPTSVI